MNCEQTRTHWNKFHTESDESSLFCNLQSNGAPRAILWAMITYWKRILFCGIAFVAVANAQSVGDFADEWNCRHAGKIIMKISITKDSPMKLSFLAAPFHIGESGEIDKVEGNLDIEEVMVEYKLEKGKLKFKTRTESGAFTEYEMKLEGKVEASLTIGGAPDFVSPLRFQRRI